MLMHLRFRRSDILVSINKGTPQIEPCLNIQFLCCTEMQNIGHTHKSFKTSYSENNKNTNTRFEQKEEL